MGGLLISPLPRGNACPDVRGMRVRRTMTLVDLPGIAKVAVGDQPGDIEKRIRRMVLEYIRHPTCVILAVSAANADLVNSDALELARTADPDGRRTVGARTECPRGRVCGARGCTEMP